VPDDRKGRLSTQHRTSHVAIDQRATVASKARAALAPALGWRNRANRTGTAVGFFPRAAAGALSFNVREDHCRDGEMLHALHDASSAERKSR
jgi:hypothetical protein